MYVKPAPHRGYAHGDAQMALCDRGKLPLLALAWPPIEHIPALGGDHEDEENDGGLYRDICSDLSGLGYVAYRARVGRSHAHRHVSWNAPRWKALSMHTH